MSKDYSNKNLQKASFRNADLSNVRFANSDLRGADFSGSNLKGADFTNVKTGILPLHKGAIFFMALIVSAISGYLAMLTGQVIQKMLHSADIHVRISGVVAIIMIVLTIVFSYWKGAGVALKYVIIPVSILALLIGVVAYATGWGTGMGMLYLFFSLALVTVMFFVGTVARVAAGSLSNIVFIVIAVAGSLVGKSLGGGIGSVILAIACAMISKRALSGAEGFEALKKVASFVTSKFGTSFRGSKLANAEFSKASIHNSDFSGADVSTVHWGDSERANCIIENDNDNARPDKE
jgi:hypothetical protein